ncbi:hypothetical protein SETIT_1G061400v2 [Setaria italica]|uniref:Uncharacterized protein n=1 Tax=Setaria italica TaxID=4555 RepID=A0A368PJF0_SETIT|nr:hypothetical protein SETIT_1G061400v2 [Setaria italica]
MSNNYPIHYEHGLGFPLICSMPLRLSATTAPARTSTPCLSSPNVRAVRRCQTQ